MASPNRLEPVDAVAKAHNLLHAGGYTPSSTIPGAFTKGSVTIHVDAIASVARKVTVSSGSEQLLATVPLRDDVQAALSAIL